MKSTNSFEDDLKSITKKQLENIKNENIEFTPEELEQLESLISILIKSEKDNLEKDIDKTNCIKEDELTEEEIIQLKNFISSVNKLSENDLEHTAGWQKENIKYKEFDDLEQIKLTLDEKNKLNNQEINTKTIEIFKKIAKNALKVAICRYTNNNFKIKVIF